MNSTILIKNAVVITPTEKWARGWLLAREGKIELLGRGSPPDLGEVETIDAGGLILLPGFIDVHAHGWGGRGTMDADPEALRAMATSYAGHGVTAFLASTWTESRENIRAVLEVVAEIQGPQPRGATILGVHLEGPYLNAAKCGAQDTQHIRIADREEALDFLDIGVIRLMAVAPEIEENHWLIEECVRRGITVSAAHTAATYDQIRRAVALGITHSTHTYNAMVGLNHREPGTVGAMMTSPEIRCELIADNFHVHPAAMQILFAAKGPDGVMLITDAVESAGLPDGDYKMGERPILVRNGTIRLPDGTIAGSSIPFNRGVRNFMQATGQPLEAIWKASSLNAARSIHISTHKGSLEVGKDADLVLVDEHVNVHLTIAEGQIVHTILGRANNG